MVDRTKPPFHTLAPTTAIWISHCSVSYFEIKKKKLLAWHCKQPNTASCLIVISNCDHRRHKCRTESQLSHFHFKWLSTDLRPCEKQYWYFQCMSISNDSPKIERGNLQKFILHSSSHTFDGKDFFLQVVFYGVKYCKVVHLKYMVACRNRRNFFQFLSCSFSAKCPPHLKIWEGLEEVNCNRPDSPLSMAYL